MPAAWIGAITAVAGTGFSIFGASQQQSSANAAARAQAKYNKQLYKYQWKEAKRDYRHANEGRDIAIQNNENELAFREATAQQDWKYGMAIRDYRYNNAMRQYNQSEKNYKQQLSFNNLAAAEAYENEYRQYREIGIQNAFQSQDMMVASLQEEGAAKARGQAGRSATKSVQSALAAYGRNVAIMEESMRSAKAQHAANLKGINLKKLEADLVAEAARMIKPEMEPALPEPLSMPRTIFQNIKKPKKPPAPVGVAYSSGAMTSAIGAGLSTLGSINWGSIGKPSAAAQTRSGVSLTSGITQYPLS